MTDSRAVEIVVEYKRQQWAKFSQFIERRDTKGASDAEERAIAADEILQLLKAEMRCE